MANSSWASGTDQSGSAIYDGPTNPNTLGSGVAGQPNQPQVDYQALYKELEQKLGLQGRELGEYRTFFDGVAPLLDRLDKSPALVQAIIDGKIDENVATAALEGKITLGEAQTITQAHTQVQEELGAKAYDKATPADIARLVEERVSQVRGEMEGKLRESEDNRVFENQVNDFIERTPDFTEYASDIDDWLDDHEDVTDIETSYYAVKGQLSEREAVQRSREEQAEYAKQMAMNAGGGGGGVYSFPEGSNIVDQFIAGRSNPNVF